MRTRIHEESLLGNLLAAAAFEALYRCNHPAARAYLASREFRHLGSPCAVR